METARSTYYDCAERPTDDTALCGSRRINTSGRPVKTPPDHLSTPRAHSGS